MSLKWGLAACIVSFCVGGVLAQRYLAHEVVTEKERIVTKDHVVTVIKEVVRPDGSKETDTTIVDDSTKKEDSSKVTIKAVPQWRLDVEIRTSLDLVPIYQVQVSRRLFGPVMVGVSISTDKTLGLSAGMEF